MAKPRPLTEQLESIADDDLRAAAFLIVRNVPDDGLDDDLNVGQLLVDAISSRFAAKGPLSAVAPILIVSDEMSLETMKFDRREASRLVADLVERHDLADEWKRTPEISSETS